MKYLFRFLKSIRGGCSDPNRSCGHPARCDRGGNASPEGAQQPRCAHSQVLLLDLIGLDVFLFAEFWTYLNFQHSQCLLAEILWVKCRVCQGEYPFPYSESGIRSFHFYTHLMLYLKRHSLLTFSVPPRLWIYLFPIFSSQNRNTRHMVVFQHLIAA